MFRPHSSFDFLRVGILFFGMFFFNFSLFAMQRRNVISIAGDDGLTRFQEALKEDDKAEPAVVEALGGEEVCGLDGTGGGPSVAGSVVSEESAPGAVTGRLRHGFEDAAFSFEESVRLDGAAVTCVSAGARASGVSESKEVEETDEGVGCAGDGTGASSLVAVSVGPAVAHGDGVGIGSSEPEAPRRWRHEPLLDWEGQFTVYGSLYQDPYVFGEKKGRAVYQSLGGDPRAILNCLDHCDGSMRDGFKGLISMASVSRAGFLEKHALYWQGVKKAVLSLIPDVDPARRDFELMIDPFYDGALSGIFIFHKLPKYPRKGFFVFVKSCSEKIGESLESGNRQGLVFWIGCKVRFTGEFYAAMPYKEEFDYFTAGKSDAKDVFHAAAHNRLMTLCSSRMEYYTKSKDQKEAALLLYWQGFLMGLEEAFKLCSEGGA